MCRYICILYYVLFPAVFESARNKISGIFGGFFCFCFCFFADLLRPGLEPASPALAGRFSTTAPPGKPSPRSFVLHQHSNHQKPSTEIQSPTFPPTSKSPPSVLSSQGPIPPSYPLLPKPQTSPNPLNFVRV